MNFIHGMQIRNSCDFEILSSEVPCLAPQTKCYRDRQSFSSERTALNLMYQQHYETENYEPSSTHCCSIYMQEKPISNLGLGSVYAGRCFMTSLSFPR
jgi:hypothetical protein